MTVKSVLERYGILLLILANCIFVYLNQSTYDSGDSILHYLQAKQSFEHPRYFMDHWAKPIFVLVSSTFAQFGFIGMKFFNTICVLLSIYFSEKVLNHFKYRNAKLVWVLALFSPHVFLVQSSGLTEPLIALVLIWGTLLYLKSHFVASLTLLSFLPFIRSEGWIMLLVVLCILVFQRRYKLIPLVAVGTIIYGIIGLFYYSDFLWMFHQNPYSGIESKYGSGDLFHFVNQLPYIMGWPVVGLMVVGLFKNLKEIISSRFKLSTYHYFVVGMFLAILVAHSIFWYKGWFHSFGLKRVLLAVFPSMILLAFNGLQLINESIHSKRLRTIVTNSLAAVVVLFPFSGNKAGFSIPYDFQLDSSQLVAQKAVSWYNENHTNQSVVSFGNYYFAEILDVDIDDTKEVMLLDAVTNNSLPSGSIVFWDDYFSFSDKGVSQNTFTSDSYDLLHVTKATQRNRTSEVRIYRRK